jgi:hypothetical protein
LRHRIATPHYEFARSSQQTYESKSRSSPPCRERLAPIPQHSDCKWSPPRSEKIEEFKLA